MVRCALPSSVLDLLPLTLFRADLDNMKGSTVDAMSAAIDNAAVMVFCISLAYKESSSEHTIPGHSLASV